MQTRRLALAGDLVLLRPLERNAADAASAGMFRHLRDAVWSMANLEVPLTDRPDPQPWGMRSLMAPAARASDLASTGLRAVNIANNHSSDQGIGGLESTRAVCAEFGVETFGFGRSAEEALGPLFVPAERWSGGSSRLDLAIIAATCVGHPDMIAAEGPGVAGIRVSTRYEVDEERVHEQPGWPPRVVTSPDAGEVDGLVAAVRRARERTPLVIVSMHWGVTLQEGLADYQRELACALAEAGASAIFGHQAHVLQAVECVGTTPVFYGLGSLVFHYEGDISHRVPDDTAVATLDVDTRTGAVTAAQLNLGRFDERGEPVDADPGWVASVAARIVRLSHGLDGELVFDGVSTLHLTPDAGMPILAPAEDVSA